MIRKLIFWSNAVCIPVNMLGVATGIITNHIWLMLWSAFWLLVSLNICLLAMKGE